MGFLKILLLVVVASCSQQGGDPYRENDGSGPVIDYEGIESLSLQLRRNSLFWQAADVFAFNSKSNTLIRYSPSANKVVSIIPCSKACHALDFMTIPPRTQALLLFDDRGSVTAFDLESQAFIPLSVGSVTHYAAAADAAVFGFLSSFPEQELTLFSLRQGRLQHQSILLEANERAVLRISDSGDVVTVIQPHAWVIDTFQLSEGRYDRVKRHDLHEYRQWQEKLSDNSNQNQSAFEDGVSDAVNSNVNSNSNANTRGWAMDQAQIVDLRVLSNGFVALANDGRVLLQTTRGIQYLATGRALARLNALDSGGHYAISFYRNGLDIMASAGFLELAYDSHQKIEVLDTVILAQCPRPTTIVPLGDDHFIITCMSTPITYGLYSRKRREIVRFLPQDLVTDLNKTSVFALDSAQVIRFSPSFWGRLSRYDILNDRLYEEEDFVLKAFFE